MSVEFSDPLHRVLTHIVEELAHVKGRGGTIEESNWYSMFERTFPKYRGVDRRGADKILEHYATTLGVAFTPNKAQDAYPRAYSGSNL